MYLVWQELLPQIDLLGQTLVLQRVFNRTNIAGTNGFTWTNVTNTYGINWTIITTNNEFTRRNITTRTGLIRQALLMEIDLPAQLLIALMVLLESTQLPQTGQKVSTLTGFLEWIEWIGFAWVNRGFVKVWAHEKFF